MGKYYRTNIKNYPVMPIYLYSHPKTGEVKEVHQTMKEEHVFFDEKGVEWKRVFCIPQMNMDTKLDPNSIEDFVRYTGARKGTLGEMQDLSAELSKARADKNGNTDPVKESFLDQQEKNTGKVSFERKRKKAKEKLNKLGFDLE